MKLFYASDINFVRRNEYKPYNLYDYTNKQNNQPFFC